MCSPTFSGSYYILKFNCLNTSTSHSSSIQISSDPSITVNPFCQVFSVVFLIDTETLASSLQYPIMVGRCNSLKPLSLHYWLQRRVGTSLDNSSKMENISLREKTNFSVKWSRGHSTIYFGCSVYGDIVISLESSSMSFKGFRTVLMLSFTRVPICLHLPEFWAGFADVCIRDS